MYLPDQKEVEFVSKLSFGQRYQYFIKRAVDTEIVWGLWEGGWVLGKTSNGDSTLPVWPAKEFAELCRIDQWETSESRPIPLGEFISDLLPSMKEKGIRVAVFDLPTGDSSTLPIGELINDFFKERQKYL